MSDNIWRWSRYHTRASVLLTTSLITTPEIDISQAASGMVLIPTGSNATVLTLYGSPWTLGTDPGLGGANATQYTYVPLFDLTGTSGSPGGAALVIYGAAGQGYQIPPAVFGCRGLKIVAGSGGLVDISLKG